MASQSNWDLSSDMEHAEPASASISAIPMDPFSNLSPIRQAGLELTMPAHVFLVSGASTISNVVTSESNPHRQPDTGSTYVSHRLPRLRDPEWWTMWRSHQSALTAGRRT